MAPTLGIRVPKCGFHEGPRASGAIHYEDSPPGIDDIATGMFFGVRKGIGSFDALKGKRLGLLGIGSCPDWIAPKILMRHGLEPNKDVTFVPLLDQYPRIIEIMEEGGIDAYMAMEPNLSIGKEKGLLDVWAAGFDEPYLPHYQREVPGSKNYEGGPLWRRKYTSRKRLFRSCVRLTFCTARVWSLSTRSVRLA